MAVGTSIEEVRIYRLVEGQGFRTEQTFHASGVESIISYSIDNETYLSLASQSKTEIFVARVRGLKKPFSQNLHLTDGWFLSSWSYSI